MSTTIVCPDCRRPQVPLEECGRLICPDCSAELPPGLHEPGSSALDLPASGPPRPSGSITLLRSGLRDEEKNQQGGRMEGLFSRRGKAPAGQGPPPSSRADRGPVEEPAIPKLSKKSTRVDSPFSGEESSRPAPGPADRPDVSRRLRPDAPIDREGDPDDRVPVTGTLALVVVGALSMAALLRGPGPWANLLFLVTVGLLGFSLLGILHRRGARGAFWQGFALFGWGYLAMAFAPWAPQPTGPELPTSQLLATFHEKYGTSAGAARDPSPPPTPSPIGDATPPRSRPSGLNPLPAKAASIFFAGDFRQFSIVGHCLFALTAALVGSGLARWFQRSNLGPA